MLRPYCMPRPLVLFPATTLAVIPKLFNEAGFDSLAITLAHAQLAGTFPHPHRDPFDRMLAAQSTLEDLPIVSRDDALAPFGVQLLW